MINFTKIWKRILKSDRKALANFYFNVCLRVWSTDCKVFDAAFKKRKHRIVQTTHVAEMDPPKDLYLHHFSKDRLRSIVTTPYAILFGHWCSQIFQESLSLQDRKESRQFQLKWYMKILWRFCVSYVEPQIFTYISRVTLSLLSLKKGTEKIMQDRGKQI